jgi:hypothetical protein
MSLFNDADNTNPISFCIKWRQVKTEWGVNEKEGEREREKEGGADLRRSGPLSKRTFVEADLRRSGPSSKRTFVEFFSSKLHLCQKYLQA